MCSLDTNPLTDTWFSNIFSHFLGFLFIFLMMTFDAKVFLFLWSPVYLLFSLVVCAFVIMSKKSLTNSNPGRIIPVFSSKNLIALTFTFGPLIHFELIFICAMRKDPVFILLHVDVQLSQHCLLKSLFFPHWIVLTALFKSTDHKYKSLFLIFQFYLIDLCVYFYASIILLCLL